MKPRTRTSKEDEEKEKEEEKAEDLMDEVRSVFSTSEKGEDAGGIWAGVHLALLGLGVLAGLPCAAWTLWAAWGELKAGDCGPVRLTSRRPLADFLGRELAKLLGVPTWVVLCMQFSLARDSLLERRMH